MEIEIESGLAFQLDEEDHTATVIESPKVSGIVFIPQFVEKQTQKYIVISIESFAFTNTEIEYLTFPVDSEIISFQTCAFNCANIKKLQIPSNLAILENGWSLGVNGLVDIEVSPNNKNFKYIENTYLVGKSNENSKNFDVLHFARYDIEKAVIPPQIKIIKEYSFYNYDNLNSLIIPAKSKLEIIEENAFSSTPLKFFQFLDKNVELKSNFFSSCYNISVISFQKATKITLIENESNEDIPKEAQIQVKPNAELIGFKKYLDQIKFIDEPEEDNDTLDEIDILINHIRFLENRLRQYENVIPFKLSDLYEKRKKEEFKFFDDKDESQQEVIEKIGEGSTSITYKVVDNRTSQVMCKKILKTDRRKTTFNDLQNIMKEFQVLQSINHPSICKAFAINTQEKATEILTDPNDDDDDELEEDILVINKIQKVPKTTVALFLEFFNYSLKDCIENNILNNTLKVRIAIELAFGMSYIHNLGLIHRDLKIENIMLNDVFESKIIDFGLVHVDNTVNQRCSLTKGIGTLAYMSPEMANEEEYDEKTDVYSYGVVLFAIFTGHLPKQSLKDKLNNKQFRFPPPSSSISSYCIELIKKCMSFEPPNRPSFDEIIDDMNSHSFSLAKEIDKESICKRYLYLNRLKYLKQQEKP